jgi:hypothetical protein
MQTGDLVISTGLFRTQCSCGTAQELRRGQECPPCPTCGQDAEWTFQRGTYRQAPPPGSVRQPPDAELPPPMPQGGSPATARQAP